MALQITDNPGFYPSKLHEFIDRRLVQGEPVEIDSQLATTRKICKTVSIAVAGAGRIPTFVVNLALGERWGSRYGIGIPLGVTHGAGFGAIVTWTLSSLIDDTTYKHPPELQAVLKKERSMLGKLGLLATSTIFGVTTLIPIAFIVYISSNRNIVMPIIILTCEAGLPVYGNYLLQNATIEKAKMSGINKKLLNIKEDLVNHIRSSGLIISSLSEEKRVELINLHEKLKENPDSMTRVTNYLFNTLKLEHRQARTMTMGDLCVTVLGGLITAGHLGFQAYIAKRGGEALFKSSAVGYSLGGMVIIGNSFLDRLGIINRAKQTYHALKDLCTGERRVMIEEEFSPKLAYASKSLAIAIAFFGWGVSVEAGYTFLTGPLRIAAQVVSSMADVLLISTGALFVAEQVIRRNILKISRDDVTIQNILELSDDIKKLIRAIEDCTYLEFSRFLRALPNDKIEAFLAKAKLTSRELDEYIDRNLDQLPISASSGSSPVKHPVMLGTNLEEVVTVN